MDKTSTALPVAPLAQALEQYEDALRPVLSPADYAALQAECGSFRLGEGAVLQAELESYAAGLGGKSWLRDYSRQRFLSLRDPLTIIGNFSLLFTPQPLLSAHSQAENAAALALSVARLFTELRSDAFPVPAGNDAAVLDEQMRQVLAAVRIPLEGTDGYVRYPDGECRRFGVFFRNRFYTVGLFDGDGAVVPGADILAGLQWILSRPEAGEPVGFHTAAYAGSAFCAGFYRELCTDGDNLEAMEAARHTVFNIALKERRGDELPFEKMLFLDTEDLWPYKPWSFLLYTDGALAVNNEHTSVDGVTNVHMYGYMLDYMERAFAQLTPGGHGDAVPVAFRLTGAQEKQLLSVRDAYLKKVSPLRVRGWQRRDVDLDAWKSRGIGRDALIQMAFCYAGARLYKSPRCIHESVSTAQFYQGRTSCLRPVTDEMAAAVDALMADAPADELIEKLRLASKAHSRGIKRAKNNVCFVRHGAGLMLMQRLFGKELGIEETPPIFTSGAYKRFCSQEISTSTVGASPAVASFGFAPQVPDGLGIGYLPLDGGLSLTYSWDETALADGGSYGGYLTEFFDKVRHLPDDAR